MAVDLSPYSNVKPFFGQAPTWLTDAGDIARIQAYQIYEAMYWSSPGAYSVIQRGSEANPVYIPSLMTIVEAKNRYLCKDWAVTCDPKVGTPADQLILLQTMNNIMRREQMTMKFRTQKRWGMVRGDQVWHIVADEEKLEGKRISIYEVDPAMYFPIFDPANDDRLIGVHLVEQLPNLQDNLIIKRQTYRKTETGSITYELTWWELGSWDDRTGTELKPAEDPPSPAVPEFELDPLITSIPVYHIKNDRSPMEHFGNSEARGIERAVAAISQAASDQELALALDGIGMYVTTSGPPVDENDVETNWRIGPGMVAEIDPDSDWKRVPGVSNLPALEHIAYLEKSIRQAKGVPDVAIGLVDAADASSGIALALKFAPMLSGNSEKEDEILSVMDHMLYDLSTMWLPAYEGITALAQLVSVVGDPLPVNREAVLSELKEMVALGVITVEYACAVLSEKLGYDFPANMGEAVVAEMALLAEARNRDPFQSRVEQELEGGATA